MRAAALVCKSYYSLLRYPVSVTRLVQRAAESGYTAVALADVNGMYGLVELTQTCRRHGLQAILGVEIRTPMERVVFLAEDGTGYGNLCRITTARHLDRPFCLFTALRQDARGLIALGHDPALAQRLKAILGPDRVFIPGHDLAAMDITILDPDDVPTARLMNRIRVMGTGLNRDSDAPILTAMPPEPEFQRRFNTQALRNNMHLVERCTWNLLDEPCHLPRIPVPPGTTADRLLGQLCHRGLVQRYGRIRPEVLRRLEHELNAIRQSGFSDYFLVVRKIIDFARARNIPVDVRGSAAGSLVSYVLGLTRVCPIAHDLYFERFLNPGRTDCPDIDVDLCWRRRDEVIRFCYDHWGDDHVAMICNINRYRRRGARRDAARVLGLDPSGPRRPAPHRPDDARLDALAKRLMGIPRHLGVHCGGLVITPEPVARLAPLERAAKGVVVTQYDKDAAEAAGLVKIDLLGNRSLSTVHETVCHLGLAAPDIEHLDPADKVTAQMLTRGDSFGVFQCESPGMRQLLRGLRVRHRKDLAVALSLIRPGPAAGGMKTAYIDRHVHHKPFTYLHPKLQEVFADTYGVMLYQEDVMKLAVEVAGYTVAEADRFRSEVSKRVSPARLQEQYQQFVYNKADHEGIDRETAEKIWDDILRFAAYSYCKAHATVYAHIAWQSAYLKAHWPQAFYCALFNNHHGMYPMRVYVWDAVRHGVCIRPCHVNHSGREWALEGPAIRAPLTLVKGLTGRSIERILTQRPFTDLADLRRRTGCGRKELATLIGMGACDGLGVCCSAMLAELACEPAAPGQGLLFDPVPEPSRRQRRYDEPAGRLAAELWATGIPFSMHPGRLLNAAYVPAGQLDRYRNRAVTVAGWIAAARRARTTDGRYMGFVTLEDATGLAEVTFFPDHLELYRRLCGMGGPVWVRGRVCEHLATLSVHATDAGRAG